MAGPACIAFAIGVRLLCSRPDFLARADSTEFVNTASDTPVTSRTALQVSALAARTKSRNGRESASMAWQIVNALDSTLQQIVSVDTDDVRPRSALWY